MEIIDRSVFVNKDPTDPYRLWALPPPRRACWTITEYEVT